jgi:hypothetical protein
VETLAGFADVDFAPVLLVIRWMWFIEATKAGLPVSPDHRNEAG